ncbi:sulfurtransferase complex subunit TusB [Microbulbifer bruguierae]|uniref:Sulfurtransferase complex subunit TusB n=1 Tax=Microbulbifer bruguierae TaxID=3029061 RepID=A0ABY8NEG4_9GAMM|nr:sulfurtransferase complex subunit TusB [Microbulbifer bruguierae]WGL16992.1 sulfurtransferase complex subunit TusB [Microbulbifer bruguierae]
MTLHIVNQSPFAGSALSDCLDAFSDGDALLLIEDGVYGASGNQDRLPTSSVYCLSTDALARGVEIASGITAIDDEGWVALCTGHNPIVSWFR